LHHFFLCTLAATGLLLLLLKCEFEEHGDAVLHWSSH
jgi:hypothetical protein